jgi:hypothetical protein
MKKITFIIAFCLLASSVTFAQQSKDELAVVQNMYGIEKRKLVSDYMQIPEAQSVSFWSIYDKYESDRKALGAKRFELIGQYADNYKNLTDEKADEIAKGILKNNIEYDKLHEAYYAKVKKATSAITAAKFIQLETYLQSEIRNEISENIPFIGEIEMLQEKKSN